MCGYDRTHQPQREKYRTKKKRAALLFKMDVASLLPLNVLVRLNCFSKDDRATLLFSENKSESESEPREPTAADMAGTHSHALLVEFEKNNVPRLKNKLVKYFQSKKSNGGDCEVDHENGGTTAVVRFLKQEGKSAWPGKLDHGDVTLCF